MSLGLDLAAGPALMGIVNASPDSFSDGGRYATLDAQMRLAEQLTADGAAVLDVGGQSGITGVPELEAGVEIERVVPLIERIAAALDVVISVDTYKPAVAEVAVAAGARIVNDVSGLLYPELAEVCARTGAGLVVMHNRSRPKERLTRDDLYDDVRADVLGFLAERVYEASRRGVPRASIVVDPGPDFAKTPAQTVAVLRDLERVRELGFPVLLALSRKDFIGTILSRPPRERLAGTLAAVGMLGDAPNTILRVHDVAEVRDYLAVRRVLDGRDELDPGARLDPSMRRQQAG